jgi:hypothetical protein
LLELPELGAGAEGGKEETSQLLLVEVNILDSTRKIPFPFWFVRIAPRRM